MVADLTDSASGSALDTLMFGGAPAPDSLAARARVAFPAASMYVASVPLLSHGR